MTLLNDQFSEASEEGVEGESTVQPGQPEKAPFYWSEGMAGVGDKPEWFKDTKYKSVADQAKAYTELEKKFGGFKGSPDKYELPEDLTEDDTYVQMLSGIGKEARMNQETFNKVLEVGMAWQQAQLEVNRELEMEALGHDADKRIANVSALLRNNLGDEYEELAEAVNSAAAVKLVEALAKKLAPSKLPTGQSSPQTAVTQHEIDQMMTKKDENGRTLYHVSESYRDHVRQAIARMHGASSFSYTA